MSKTVFISYSHAQQDFVRRNLVPVLRAAECGEVFIDNGRFGLGPPLVAQMDAYQDKADVSLLLLSAEYLASPNCVHEMNRAIAADPAFTRGKSIVVKVGPCSLPPSIKVPNPLYGDMTDPTQPGAWFQLLRSLGANGLGCPAPVWLEARNRCAHLLKAGMSVNLHAPTSGNWESLVVSLRNDFRLVLPSVNLQSGETASRPGLVAAMLRELGLRAHVPPKQGDLLVLQRQFDAALGPCRLVLERFHNVRDRHVEYEIDLFRSLRYLQNRGKAVFLLHSRHPLASVVPADHPDSQLLSETVILA